MKRFHRFAALLLALCMALGGMALAEDLTGEEMDHLAQVAAQPESTAHSDQSIRDYISVIRGEGLLRAGGQEDDLLRAAQKKYLEKKAYMEEQP